MVTLEGGDRVAVEHLARGMRIASLDVEGLARDQDFPAQYEWSADYGILELKPEVGEVSEIRHGEHAGCVVINGRLRVTPEHPLMLRRGDAMGFAPAEFAQVGDFLVDGSFGLEEIVDVARSSARVETVAVNVPGLNMLIADGVFIHNDTSLAGSSSGGSSGASSGESSDPPKSSGSSFSSSSGSSGASGSSSGGSSGGIGGSSGQGLSSSGSGGGVG